MGTRKRAQLPWHAPAPIDLSDAELRVLLDVLREVERDVGFSVFEYKVDGVLQPSLFPSLLARLPQYISETAGVPITFGDLRVLEGALEVAIPTQDRDSLRAKITKVLERYGRDFQVEATPIDLPPTDSEDEG